LKFPEAVAKHRFKDICNVSLKTDRTTDCVSAKLPSHITSLGIVLLLLYNNFPLGKRS